MKIDFKSMLSIFNHVSDGVYFVDSNRIIVHWNQAAERISGFMSDEVIGRPCSDNILTHVDESGDAICLGKCPLQMSILDKMPRSTDIYMHHKDGHRIPVAVKSAPLIDPHGHVIGAVEIFRDKSNKLINEERLKELENMAMLDKLTRLANRHYIEKEMLRRIDEKQRYQSSFGVFFMDVDHFKMFNDTYGHDVGDRVLIYIAKTLLANSRVSDLYGRWGGEEFIGIIQGITLENLTLLGDRIRLLVEKSYIMHQDNPLHVTLSIGGTLAQAGETMDDIIKRADTLVYECKNKGRNCVSIG